jgi:hypothetical protein
MIETDRELEIVKEQIEFLRKARDGVFARNTGTPFMMHHSASSFESKMRQLWGEVDEYESRTGRRSAEGNKSYPAERPDGPESAPVSGSDSAIKSESGLQQTKEAIDSLRKARDGIFKRNEGTPFMMHLSAVGFERMMSQLLAQVEEYETRVGRRNEPVVQASPVPQPGVIESAPVPLGGLDPR